MPITTFREESMELTPSPPLSLGSRIINVFTAPSEAYQGIEGLPSKTSLWLVPFLVGMVGITQEQADQQIQAMENMGSLIMVFGAIAAIFFMALAYFGGSLVLWLVCKFAFKTSTGYTTYLGAYGLSSWIGILGGIVTALLMMGLGSMSASAGAALLVSDFDSLNTTHRLISRIELFAIWQAVVMGLGLSAITGKSAGTGIATALVLWIIWALLSSLAGIGM
jgi:hypothetical protein